MTATSDQPGTYYDGQGPASIGKQARLDLRATSAGYDAVLTPEWETPAAMTAQVVAGKLVLTGSAELHVGSVSDTWSELDLAVDGDRLTGSFAGTGRSITNDGDVVYMKNLSGNGSLGADASTPELRATGIHSGPQDTLLPWDQLALTAREPVDTSAWRGKTTLQVGSASPSLIFSPDTTALWSGGTQLLAHLGSWTNVRGDAVLATAGGLEDRAGHASVELDTKLGFLDLGDLATRFDFDGQDVAHPGSWGKTQLVSGGACDVGGCMEIGPTSAASPCAIEHHGIAGRMDATGKTKLRVHYRVRENSPFNDSMPPLGPPAMGVFVTTPGDTTGTTEPSKIDTMTDLGAAAPFRWQSAWLTVDVSLPANAHEIGFSVSPFAGYGCAGGPAMPPMATDVFVDSITLE